MRHGTIRYGSLTMLCLLSLMLLNLRPAAGMERDERLSGPFTEQMAVVLGLTAEQQENLTELDDSYQPRIRDARARLADVRRQFGLEAASATGEEAIRTAFLPVAAAEENLAVLEIRLRQEIRQALTDRQAEQLEAMLAMRPMQRPRPGKMLPPPMPEHVD